MPNQLGKEFDYLWREIVGRDCFAAFGGKVTSKINSPNQGDMRIRVLGGKDLNGDDITTTIDVKSATNPESCQAEEVDWCLMSEAAEQDKKMWYRYLEPRVHQLVAPTTPKLSAEWLYKMIQMGEADPSLGIESFQFTPHSNPSYDWKRYWEAHALAEARVTGKGITAPDGHDCFDPRPLSPFGTRHPLGQSSHWISPPPRALKKGESLGLIRPFGRTWDCAVSWEKNTGGSREAPRPQLHSFRNSRFVNP